MENPYESPKSEEPRVKSSWEEWQLCGVVSLIALPFAAFFLYMAYVGIWSSPAVVWPAMLCLGSGLFLGFAGLECLSIFVICLIFPSMRPGPSQGM